MRGTLIAIVGLLALSGMAGCLAKLGGDEGGPENRAPRAELSAEKDSAWSGETIEFDARGSNDPDGDIERWEFDFGDGSKETVTRAEDAKMEHVYARGGEYTVTVTVFDDGDAQGGALTDSASTSVAVNEEVPVAQAVLYAAPPGTGDESPTAKYNQTFEVRENADKVAVSLDVTNSFSLGSSEITVRLLDPDGEVLDEETVTVSGSEDETVELASDVTKTGMHALEIQASSGGASSQGELKVYYDEAGGAEGAADGS